jgi:hypothetical protein
MSGREPVKVGVAAILVPRQRIHPARLWDDGPPARPVFRVRFTIGLPRRRHGRHRAEPMRAPTAADAWRALMSSVLLSGQPVDLRLWLMEQEVPANQRRPHRPGRHAYRPTSGGSRRTNASTPRTTT